MTHKQQPEQEQQLQETIAKKNLGGAPTKYNEKYCEQVIEFFNRKPYEPIMLEGDDGESYPATNQQGKVLMTPCPLPTKEAFATSIGVHRESLINWAKKHPAFFDAIKKAEDLQKDILIQNGLIGNYDKTFAIFVAKNVTDMHDKQVIENTNTNIDYQIPEGATPKDAAQAYLDAVKSNDEQ